MARDGVEVEEVEGMEVEAEATQQQRFPSDEGGGLSMLSTDPTYITREPVSIAKVRSPSSNSSFHSSSSD